jgi:hypothetical protein
MLLCICPHTTVCVLILLRAQRILAMAPAFNEHPNLLSRLVRRAIPGNVWHADHITPVFLGGGT